MGSALPRVVRGDSGISARIPALLALAGRELRRHPRTTAVVLVILVVAGAAGGGYVHALRQWDAAQAAVKSGRLGEAQRSLDLCLWVWPRSVEVHLLAARAARLRGDFEGAEAHLNRCLKLQPGGTEAIQVEFLLMRVQRGEEDEVAPELLSVYVANHSPESALILETLARAYLYRLRYQPALVCLDRWVEVEPHSAEALGWRGWALERVNDHEGSLRDYRRALELDPDLAWVHLRLAETLMDRSDPGGALPHLEWLQRQSPGRADVQARLGQCRFLQGQMEEARRLLEPAVAQLPDDPAALITLAKVEIQQGRPAEAEKWLRQALAADPSDSEAALTLNASLRAQGRSAEAVAALAQFQKNAEQLTRVAHLLQEGEKPNADPAALAEVGAVFLPSNERAGLYWLNRALQRDPGQPAAHKALAEYYERKGDLEKAALHRRWLPSARDAEATGEKTSPIGAGVSSLTVP